MEQEQIIKLTLAGQIASQVAKQYCKHTDKDQDTIAKEVIDLTMKIVEGLYERV